MASTRFGSVNAIVLLMALSAHFALNAAQAAEPYDASQLKSAWQEINDSNSKLAVTWNSTVFRSSQCNIFYAPYTVLDDRDYPRSLDGAMTLQCKVSLDGVKMRYEDQGPMFDEGLQEFVDERSVSVYDGVQSGQIDFNEKREDGSRGPLRTVFNIDRNVLARRTFRGAGALAAFRPLDPLYGPLLGGDSERALENLQWVKRYSAGGEDLLLLHQYFEGKPLGQQFVVSETNGFRLMEIVQYSPSSIPSYRIHWTYDGSSVEPMRWTVDDFASKGELQNRWSNRIIKVDRKPEFADDEFILQPSFDEQNLSTGEGGWESNEAMFAGELQPFTEVPQSVQSSLVLDGDSWPWQTLSVAAAIVLGVIASVLWQRYRAR